MAKYSWTPIPMFCSNCGELNYGYRDEKERIRYVCKRCKTVLVCVKKSRRHDTVDLFAPKENDRYGGVE